MSAKEEPPYKIISNLIKNGEVVPFLGAGVNFGMRQPPNAQWAMKTANFLPSGADLSNYLIEQCEFPDKDEKDLAKVSSYYAEVVDRDALSNDLVPIFDRDYEPCEIHHYLAADIPPDKNLLIVTTNYDDLIERAFIRANRPFDLVVHPTDSAHAASVIWWKYQASEPEYVEPNLLHIDLDHTTVIYKMHGSVDRAQHRMDNYVITEDDYIDFLTRMIGRMAVPAQFMAHFRTHRFLFMGYGLNDWNLRVILNNLQALDTLRAKKSWAIQSRPSAVEKRLWNKRNVDIYDVDINEFTRQLRARE
ncbi:MAG: SIR2 family protein [Acidobacteriota bacterium]|nr:SIR2 family protein [Acidobacteriota bacterium]